MIILLDNGHGEGCVGKGSPDALSGNASSPLAMREWKWSREVAWACKEILCARGYDARLLVPEATDIPLSVRVSRANAVCNEYGTKNVLLVSIHNNAAGEGSRWMTARGWSIYTTRGITEADRLAEKIHETARSIFKSPLTVRSYSNTYLGRDYEEDFYILRHTYCPAVLVENFFQDNKQDVEYILSDAGKRNCIRVITKGIENYLSGR